MYPLISAIINKAKKIIRRTLRQTKMDPPQEGELDKISSVKWRDRESGRGEGKQGGEDEDTATLIKESS